MSPVVNKSGLQIIILGLSGLTQSTSVIWGLDPTPFISDVDRAMIYMKVRQFQPEGNDDTRYSLSGTTFTTEQCGQRVTVLTMRAEVYDQSLEASDLLETVRVGLRLPTTIVALNAINLAYVRCGPTQDVNYEIDNRVVNAATMEVWLNGIVDISSTQNNEGWIETVNSNNKIPGTITG